MSSSPKRRKTSPVSYVNAENETDQRSKTTTPRRASYQSPTKASLARTNPDMLKELAQAKERRESESARRQSLRDRILNRNTRQDEDTAMVDAEEVESGQIENVESTPVSETQQDRALDLAHIFKDIPHSSPAKETTEPELPQSPIPPTSISRVTSSMAGQMRSPSIVPRLVPSSQPRRESRSPSTELPPTPVQLGSPVTRPRGLASSSPGGRNRRSRMNHVVTTSPLKPRDLAPVFLNEEPREDYIYAEVASGIGDELDRIDETDQLDALLQVDFEDENLQSKQTELFKLSEMARNLQDECDDLDRLGSKIYGQFPMPKFPAEDFEQLLDSIIDNTQNRKPESWRRPENHDKFQKDYQTYLDLIKPDNLQLTYEIMYEERGLHTTSVALSIQAANPLTKDALDLLSFLDVDSATGKLMTCGIHNDPKKIWPAPLKLWAAEFDSINLDVMITVVSNHLAADVQRASILHSIEHPEDEIDYKKLTRLTAAKLVPYLNQKTSKVTIRSRGKMLTLSYGILIDWIGHATPKTEVITYGCSADTKRNIRIIFREVESIDGTLKAFRAIQTLLMDEGPTMPSKKARERPKKKARRMTVFD